MSSVDGWAWPGLARKAHFFREGRSLCGRWLYTGPLCQNQVEDDMAPGREDCWKCFLKREQEKKRANQVG